MEEIRLGVVSNHNGMESSNQWLTCGIDVPSNAPSSAKAPETPGFQGQSGNSYEDGQRYMKSDLIVKQNLPKQQNPRLSKLLHLNNPSNHPVHETHELPDDQAHKQYDFKL
jgi:hypothetical protein